MGLTKGLLICIIGDILIITLLIILNKDLKLTIQFKMSCI